MNKSAIKEEELTIGRWGRTWQRFMQENYPVEAAELKGSNRFDELAFEKRTVFGSSSVSNTQRQILDRLLLWKR